jgi:hypothetical protein
MSQKEGDQLYDQGVSGLRAVQDLKGGDTFELRGRISDNIRQVAIQRKQNCVQLLGLGGDQYLLTKVRIILRSAG